MVDWSMLPIENFIVEPMAINVEPDGWPDDPDHKDENYAAACRWSNPTDCTFSTAEVVEIKDGVVCQLEVAYDQVLVYRAVKDLVSYFNSQRSKATIELSFARVQSRVADKHDDNQDKDEAEDWQTNEQWVAQSLCYVILIILQPISWHFQVLQDLLC